MVVVWYLMGWLHYLWKDSDSAAFYLQQTEKVRHSAMALDDSYWWFPLPAVLQTGM